MDFQKVALNIYVKRKGAFRDATAHNCANGPYVAPLALYKRCVIHPARQRFVCSPWS
jgi:hypothetical protein